MDTVGSKVAVVGSGILKSLLLRRLSHSSNIRFGQVSTLYYSPYIIKYDRTLSCIKRIPESLRNQPQSRIVRIFSAKKQSMYKLISNRGPGGRTSQRKEITEDGMELFFDHGAPFFAVTDEDVKDLVSEWEARGVVAEWKDKFGTFDCVEAKFVGFEKEELNKKYVGTPGMNAISKAMCSEPGVDAKFGVVVSTFQWLEDKNLWTLIDSSGQTLGEFDAVVVSDVYMVSPRFTAVTGRPPPLDLSLVPELALQLQVVPALPCFSLMLAFSEPLSSIPVRAFSFKNSNALSWAFCDSSKPGRSTTSECWVLHSTTEYAKLVITETGQKMLSNSTLSRIAEELFQEFQRNQLNIPRPFFMRAHRWDTAFPAIAVAGDEKCLWDSSMKLAICGDFCVSPNVEGAILSGLGAATKILDILNP